MQVAGNLRGQLKTMLIAGLVWFVSDQNSRAVGVPTESEIESMLKDVEIEIEDLLQ
ncbi:hypothetical protein LF1_31070 [Rubripirellula obstinata]|uniref:Uncharacterized protein n=1 Tax=Rubripirellula obstinata TaxID=406547 RepID=A0A5B1CH91_9BACT|nr:hypothetical protein [Rubripirellula obstinata]KAA1260567.1 hypothetical protein LF1_31070 [Rubripirellula obstinata]